MADVTCRQISGAMTNIIYRCNSQLTEEVRSAGPHLRQAFAVHALVFAHDRSALQFGHVHAAAQPFSPGTATQP